MIKSDTSHSLHGSIAMSQVHLDEDDGESYEKQAGSLRVEFTPLRRLRSNQSRVSKQPGWTWKVQDFVE